MKIGLVDDFVPVLVRDDEIVDLSAVLSPAVMGVPGRYRMNALIEQFSELRDAIASATDLPGRPLKGARLRAPIPMPSQMIFALGNYHEGLPDTSRPLGMFLKASSTILDPGGTVVLPPDTAVIFHHEAELAVVIGMEARNVSVETASDYIFGFTGLIDVSARAMGTGVGFIDKNFETFCPMGPWIALKDELPNAQDISVRLSQNGQLRQDYHTSDMEHSIAHLIAYASSVTRLRPGDVISCGTNHQGLGPMQDGDMTTLEIGGVGSMTVHVSDPQKRRWPDQIDPNIGPAIKAWRETGGHLDAATAYMKRIG
jgi:2-keto-4-pentenoate hydratase/2-oxohepta-3-ene-1,7-dioic acid hydratase in catechol pathway